MQSSSPPREVVRSIPERWGTSPACCPAAWDTLGGTTGGTGVTSAAGARLCELQCSCLTLGPNPMGTRANAESHGSHSGFTTAPSPAGLPKAPELPRALQMPAAAALIAADPAACSPPSSLLPPYPVPSTGYLFSWILPRGSRLTMGPQWPPSPWYRPFPSAPEPALATATVFV